MSELTAKEIVDVSQGVRLGTLRDADLVVDPATGSVQALVLPIRRGWLRRGELVIPWEQVVRVGRDIIVVDLQARSSEERGIASQPGGRLRPASPDSRTGKESVSGGNGHWRLQQPGPV